jgi:hypothetical protein
VILLGPTLQLTALQVIADLALAVPDGMEAFDRNERGKDNCAFVTLHEQIVSEPALRISRCDVLQRRIPSTLP